MPRRRRSLVPVAIVATVVLGAACHDATGPKNAFGIAPHGVVVAARLSRTTFGRADTVWATAVLTNPTTTPVTLPLGTTTQYGGALVAGVWALPGQTPSMVGFGGGYISGISTLQPTQLVVPAHDSLTFQFPYSVDAAAPTGGYTFRAAIYPYDTVAHRMSTVVSNTVTATLHD